MSGNTQTIDRERNQELLIATSRTFALCIPIVPGMLRDALGLGCLLLRNADMIEDAYRWPKAHRIELLESYKRLLQDPDPQVALEYAELFDDGEDQENPDHLELLRSTPYLVEQVALLPRPYGEAITEHVSRVIDWMQKWVGRHDDGNRMTLLRLKQLDDYCYAVARGNIDVQRAWDDLSSPLLELDGTNLMEPKPA